MEKCSRDKSAMIIEGMIVAPERPTIGQPLEPSHSPPDRQPVGNSQSCEQEDRQQRPSRSAGSIVIGIRVRAGRPRTQRWSCHALYPFLRRQRESGRDQPWAFPPVGCPTSSLWRSSVGVYGKCGPQDSNLQPRDSRALAFPRGLDYLILRRSGPGPARSRYRLQPSLNTNAEAGRSSAGIIVGAHPASL